jgi:hypothetical protein
MFYVYPSGSQVRGGGFAEVDAKASRWDATQPRSTGPGLSPRQSLGTSPTWQGGRSSLMRWDRAPRVPSASSCISPQLRRRVEGHAGDAHRHHRHRFQHRRQEHVGTLDLTVDGSQVIDVRHELICVDDKIETDAEMARRVEEAVAPHRAFLDQVVGRVHGPLDRATSLEASMDNVLLDAAAAAGTRLAFSNGWRYGAPILSPPSSSPATSCARCSKPTWSSAIRPRRDPGRARRAKEVREQQAEDRDRCDHVPAAGRAVEGPATAPTHPRRPVKRPPC